MAEAEKTAVLDKAAAAKLVKREVPAFDKDGKPTGKTKFIDVGADEVFAFKDHGDYVNVVTVDGKKLQGSKK